MSVEKWADQSEQTLDEYRADARRNAQRAQRPK